MPQTLGLSLQNTEIEKKNHFTKSVDLLLGPNKLANFQGPGSIVIQIWRQEKYDE